MFSRWRIGAQKLSRSATGAAKARSLVLLAVVVAFCSYAVAAQQDSSPAVNAPPSNSIPVRVVVRDANGNPVTGLTRSDFRVLDDKESQQLTFFSVGAPSDSRPYTALFFDDYHLAANIAQVRDAAARCIQSALDHGAHIAVYSASGSLHKDFTVGRGALLQAVSRLAPSSSDGGAAGTVSALDQLV